MSTYIFRLQVTEIIGARIAIDNAVIPNDSVEVTESDYNSYSTLKAQMRSNGRRDSPNWIDSAVVIPDDTRTLIDVSIVESDVKMGDFADITITLVNSPGYGGTQYLNAFNEIFQFVFVDGVANRNDILFPESRIYEFKSNGTLKVQNPFNIRVYR